jgi:hypothetical protein
VPLEASAAAAAVQAIEVSRLLGFDFRGLKRKNLIDQQLPINKFSMIVIEQSNESLTRRISS